MLFGLHLVDACAQTQHGNESTFTPQSFLFPNESEDLRNTANKIVKKKERKKKGSKLFFLLGC